MSHPPTKAKLFCIGFQKTGTTSLGGALEVLGYDVCGYWDFRDFAESKADNLPELVLQRAKTLMETHNAFKDTPWPVLYKECDELYPGSKFIHVERDDEKWIRSVVKDFADHPNAIHAWIYGPDAAFPKGNEDIYLERYRRHNAEVKDYFADRKDDFLSLNLKDVNWENICPFLGIDIPERPWPHLNTAGDKKRRMFISRVKSKINRFLGR